MVHTSFWIEHHLWRLHPLGYHLVNVLLHGASTVLLWLLLRRLALPGALLAAALFAVHPVQAESVAWVTERKNVLSAFFYLLALLAFLRARPLTDEARPARPLRWYALSLALFACALLSKTVTGSLPLALGLLIWWKRGRLRRADLRALLPFLGLALAAGAVTVLLEKFQVGAAGEEWSLTPVDRVLLAGRALLFYAGKILWPAHLSFIYPRWHIDATAFGQWILPLISLGILAALFGARRRLGRGPFAGALFFALTLVPALGFFDVYPFRFSYVADHFQYHADAGLIVLLVSAGAAAVRRWRLPSGAARVAGGGLVALLALLTWSQVHIYRDAETLWRETIRRNPQAWMAMNNLASVFNDTGRSAEALPLLDRCLALKPDYVEAYNNRGLALSHGGRFEEALRDCNRAVSLNPRYPDSYDNRGVILAAAGRYAEAAADYSRALELRPNMPLAYYNRANAALATGRVREAIGDYDRALALQPDFPEALNNRGSAYLSEVPAQPDSALRDFSRALELQPLNPGAYCNRGRTLATEGRFDLAVADLSRALEQQPDFALAFGLRAACRLQLRQYEDAWGDLRAQRRLGVTPDPNLIRQLTEASGHGE